MRPLLEQNHYEILELPHGCDARQVERAYHIVRTTYGTDSVATYSVFNDDDSGAILERIEEAYRVLSDPQMRAEYDRKMSELAPAVAPQTPETRVRSSEPGITPPLRQRVDPAQLEAERREASAQQPLPTFSFDDEPEEFARLIDSAEPSSGLEAQDNLADGLEPDDGIFDGAALRRIRMSMGIELSEVAERTKISIDHLRSVEEDRFEALPAAVYVRGFVREMARLLDLDALAVSRSYYELMTATRVERR